MAMEDCHEVQTVDVMSDDCCDQDATTNSHEAPKKPTGFEAILAAPALDATGIVHRAAIGVERRCGPPRHATPTEKFDCLRI